MIYDTVLDQFGIPQEKQPEKAEKTVNELDHFIIEEFVREEREKEMDALKRLEEMENKIGKLLQEAPSKDKSDDEVEIEQEDDYFNKITDDVLEDFVDGLLITLGEMELKGVIPKIESGEQARNALLAVIRRLYLKKNVVGKMSRVFARYGAKQFLRKQRAIMGKTL